MVSEQQVASEESASDPGSLYSVPNSVSLIWKMVSEQQVASEESGSEQIVTQGPSSSVPNSEQHVVSE